MDKNIINNKPKFGSSVYQGPEVLESNIGISVVQHQTECAWNRASEWVLPRTRNLYKGRTDDCFND